MADNGQGMVDLLGVPADRRLLAEDADNLPPAEQRRLPAISHRQHDRLVAAGSVMTAVTLIGGAALAIYGGGEALFGSGGAFDIALAVIGVVLVSTHWGWVHVAEYVRLTNDDRRERANAERGQAWLEAIAPYPRFSVRTSVLDDASTKVERVLHKPVITPQRTFTFVSESDGEQIFDAETPAEVIAASVETMRRQTRLQTDRLRDLWETAATAYAAALSSAEDDHQQLAAHRAAAAALSEHLNASLLEPPLVE